MHKLTDIFGFIVVAGIWLGSGYFLFLHPETTYKMQVGIIVMLIMMLFLNGIFLISLRVAASGLEQIKPLDYLLTILFGYFGCTNLRRRILAKLSNELKNQKNSTSTQTAPDKN